MKIFIWSCYGYFLGRSDFHHQVLKICIIFVFSYEDNGRMDVTLPTSNRLRMLNKQID